MDLTRYLAPLRSLVSGRRVVFVGEVATGFTSTAELVRELGASDVLIIALARRGVGALPDPEVATTRVFHAEVGPGAMDGIRATEQRIANPSPEVLDVLRSFDSQRTALVVGTFLNTQPYLDGRAFLSHRRPEWLALEDKTVVDTLWDGVGLAHAPSVIATVERRALANASSGLDDGDGVVWSGDAKEGFNGGAEYVRWIRGVDDFDDALAFFSQRCDTVRVMPFLDGIPCSIHGIVFPDYVAVFRPVEMITLRRSVRDSVHGAFAYAGCASYFDPDPDIREAMRDAARTVGAHLRSAVSYRGAFTIDGVATRDGFLPTELNPRFGAGLATLFGSTPSLPIVLLNDAISAGVDLGIDPRAFETKLLTIADAQRWGGTWKAVPTANVVPVTDRGLVFESAATSWRWAREGEAVDATVSSVQEATNARIRLTFRPEHTQVGPSVAPLAAAFWRFADANLGTNVGPVSAATAQPLSV